MTEEVTTLHEALKQVGVSLCPHCGESIEAELPRLFAAYMARQRTVRRGGRNGGRKKRKAYCSSCGELCESVAEAKAHCAGKVRLED